MVKSRVACRGTARGRENKAVARRRLQQTPILECANAEHTPLPILPEEGQRYSPERVPEALNPKP